jgi:tRNA(fMet)-specific endonuclease VapC
MFVLDTDTLTHLLRGHQRVTEKRAQTAEPVALTLVTRMEVLQGRFAAVLKAEDGEKLLLAQQRLVENERDLGKFILLTFEAEAAAEFDRLRQNKKLKKIGRADLLIASIVLVHRATLVTRNLKDFQLIPGLIVENWAD